MDSHTMETNEWITPLDRRAAYVKKLPGDFVYMRMSDFTKPDEVNRVFNDNLPLMREANGVIFDIRGNRGGTDESWNLKCPIVVLTNGYTGSAAENFAIKMKNLGLATLIGSHTIGVVSHPRYFNLLNGYRYGLSTWAYFNPDGTAVSSITPG